MQKLRVLDAPLTRATRSGDSTEQLRELKTIEALMRERLGHRGRWPAAVLRRANRPPGQRTIRGGHLTASRISRRSSGRRAPVSRVTERCTGRGAEG